MDLFASLHFIHRVWRYRVRSEKFGISFLFSRELRGKTAVDIGANQGIYSYWMHRRVGPQGRVIAFEPQPELCAHLKQLRERFRLHRLEIVEMGLSSEAGERTLRRPKTSWGGASYAFDDPHRDSIKTQVTTLDRYFESHAARPISFIKCDVEGHEDHVFRGGQKILVQDRPDLLFECQEAGNPQCKVFSYLRSLNYDGFCFSRNGFAPVSDYGSIRKTMHKKALMDFIFVPKERSSALA